MTIKEKLVYIQQEKERNRERVNAWKKKSPASGK